MKITFADKILTDNRPDLTDEEKVTGVNVNEIKKVVNANDDEKKELVEEIEKLKEDLQASQLTSEESGERIYINDSSNARFNKFQVQGNYSQETREGYNLLNNILESTTINGLTVTVNADKSVKVSGTTTASTNLTFDKHNGKLAAGTYTLKDCRTFIESTENQGLWIEGQTRTFTSEATLSNIGFFKTYSANTTVNETLYPMLVEGTEEKNYEQYGKLPTADNTSEIKTVGGNINYFNKDILTNQFLNVENGNVSDNASWRTTDFIKIESSEYTLSWKSTSKYFQCNIVFYDDAKNSIAYKKFENMTYSNTFNVDNNAKYMRISYSVRVNGEDVLREYIKLEKGKMATTYSEYEKGNCNIKIMNKNLLPIENFTKTSGDFTCKYEDGIFTMTGVGKQEFVISEFVDFQSLSKVALNKTIRFSIQDYDGKTEIEANIGSVSAYHYIQAKSLTNPSSSRLVNENLNSLRFWLGSSDTTFNNVTFKLQIEIGNTKTSFEEHQEQSFVMPAQQEMLTGDYFDFENEKEIHNWNKIQSYNGETIITSYISTTGELSTGATVYYKLETPSKLTFTDEQKTIAKQIKDVRTYKNVTNIYSIDEISPIFDVEYAKDLNTVIANLQTSSV